MDLLGYVSLTGMIQATKDGIPDVLPSVYKTKKKEVVADQGRYTVVTGTRSLAKFANYGTKAVPQTNKQIATRDVKLLHSVNSFALDPLQLQSLRGFTSYDNDKSAKDYVTLQLNHYRQLYENLRLATITRVLAHGVIYVDNEGNMLPSSSGATYTHDFGVPAGNKGTMETVTGVTGAMSNPATNIPAQIRALKKLAVETTGYELKHCFYGQSIPEYFTNNNYIKEYLAREPMRRGSILKSGDLEPEYTLEGIKFYPAYTAHYRDHNNSVVRIFGDTSLVFTPDPEEGEESWYELLEGSYTVPTTINIQADPKAAFNSTKQIHGKFAYAAMQMDPIGLNIIMGDTFMPVIRVPEAIYQLTAQ